MTKKFVEEIIRNRPDFQEVIKEHEVRNPEIDTTRLDELDDLLGFIDDLYENNKNKYANKDEIIDMFIKAQVTGNLLPVARLIENTFGKGTFRKLSEF